MNPGAKPLDPSSSVGRLRLLLRDTDSTPLSPDVPGMANYAVFSDVALEIFLLNNGDNLQRAAGNAVQSLAIEYAAAGKSIKTDDLALDIKGRGSDLLAVARSFYADADATENASYSGFFQIVSFPGRRGRSRATDRVEGSPWPAPYCPAPAIPPEPTPPTEDDNILDGNGSDDDIFDGGGD